MKRRRRIAVLGVGALVVLGAALVAFAGREPPTARRFWVDTQERPLRAYDAPDGAPLQALEILALPNCKPDPTWADEPFVEAVARRSPWRRLLAACGAPAQEQGWHAFALDGAGVRWVEYHPSRWRRREPGRPPQIGCAPPWACADPALVGPWDVRDEGAAAYYSAAWRFREDGGVDVAGRPTRLRWSAADGIVYLHVFGTRTPGSNDEEEEDLVGSFNLGRVTDEGQGVVWRVRPLTARRPR